MKRKVLISVLAVALVLTLCIGLFVACDPKTPEPPAKHTVTYTLGTYTGTGEAPAAVEVEDGAKTTLPTLGFTWENHTFKGWKAGEGETLQPGTEVTVTANTTYVAQWQEFTAADYLGIWEGELYEDTIIFDISNDGDEYQLEWNIYDLYTLTASTTGGFTFHVNFDEYHDYDPADYHIWLVDDGEALAVSLVGEEASFAKFTRPLTFDEAYIGNYNNGVADPDDDTYLFAEITSSSIKIKLPEIGTISHSLGSSTSSFEKAENGYLINSRYRGADGWENVTVHVYLGADANKLYAAVVTNGTDGTPTEFTRKPTYTVTVHYTLGTEEKTATMKTIYDEGDYYLLNNPLETLEDAAALREQLAIGESYALYYYDATATDKKGAAFDLQRFTPTADFDIIIIKESVGTLATSIDTAWYGSYEGMSNFYGPMTLTISADNGGTIAFSYQYMENGATCKLGETILTNGDALILASYDDFQESYVYYYLTRNAQADTLTLASENEQVTLTRKAEINVTATIYYMFEGTLKSAPADVEISGDAYKLVDPPEWAIPEDGGEYEAFMGQLAYGKKLEYFKYDSATGAKEGSFDPDETFTEDIAILVEFTTFATEATSIDAKYDGTFTGTFGTNAFTLTIDAAAGTINVDYGDDEKAPNPINASIADHTILTETDGGRLVFVEASASGRIEYANYYYLKEENGAFTLEFGTFTAPLTKDGEEAEGNVYIGSAVIPGKISGQVTAVKIVIDDLDAPTKFTITLDDDTVWEITEFDNDTQHATGVANLKGAYTFESAPNTAKNYSATIAILNDGSIAIYTGYRCDELVDGGNSFHKEGEEPAEPTMLDGEYVLQGGTYAHRLAFNEDGTFTFKWRGSLDTAGTYQATGENTYYATNRDNDTFTITLNDDGTLTVDSNISEYDGTYVPYVAPDWAEYKGDVTLTRGENSARLVYIKLNRNDLSSVTFKLFGDDKEYTVELKDASEDYPGYLAYFKLDDGSQSETPAPQQAYPQALIKYGTDENELIIANPFGGNDPTEAGTLSTTGTIPTPTEQVSVLVYGGAHGKPSWNKTISVTKGSHSIAEIVALLADDLPQGENKFWYFNETFRINNTTDGELWNDAYTNHDFQSLTLLYAQFSDQNWYLGVTDRDTYPQLLMANFGSTTGSGKLWKSDRDAYGTDVTYEYDLDNNTITITIEEQSFKGTLGETTVTQSGRSKYYFCEINITLKVGESKYTLGTGSPADDEKAEPLADGEYHALVGEYTLTVSAWTLTFSGDPDNTITFTYEFKEKGAAGNTYVGTGDYTDWEISDYGDGSIFVYAENGAPYADSAFYELKKDDGTKVKVTLKPGEHINGQDYVIEVEPNGTIEQLPTAEECGWTLDQGYFLNAYFTSEDCDPELDDWYYPGYKFNNITTEDVTLYAQASSNCSIAANEEYAGLVLDTITGEGSFWYFNDSFDEITVELTYTLIDGALTIQMDGQEYTGTASFDGNHTTWYINITIEYKGKQYEFGDGSTGGGIPTEATTFTGTATWECYSPNITYTITAIKIATDGTATSCEITLSANGEAAQTITVDGEDFFENTNSLYEYAGESETLYLYDALVDENSNYLTIAILADGRVAACDGIGTALGYFTSAESSEESDLPTFADLD